MIMKQLNQPNLLEKITNFVKTWVYQYELETKTFDGLQISIYLRMKKDNNLQIITESNIYCFLSKQYHAQLLVGTTISEKQLINLRFY